MQDVPLVVGRIWQHAVEVHPDAEVLTATEHGMRSATFTEVGARAGKLANALDGLGVRADDRVATLLWNTQEHVEAYLAVPAMGAVLHTINVRLSQEQITFIVEHAQDRVLLVADNLVAALAPALAHTPTVEHVVIVGSDAAAASLLRGLDVDVHRYEELLADSSSQFDCPDLDEREAAAICYTSGTTGNPKGVVYSHRSVYLHSMACAMGDSFNIATGDRVLAVVPMFHATAWGLPYTSLLVGATLVLPDHFMSARQLVRLIERARPTMAAGVPTIWNDILGVVQRDGGDLSSLRRIFAGGSAVATSLQQAMQQTCGVTMLQAWGMTETSPTAVVGLPTLPQDHPDHWTQRAKQGRLMSSVQARLVAEDGRVLPHDGTSIGEIEVKGPYVTAGYYRMGTPDSFDDGWLRTGDLGTIDRLGFLSICDRAKDMIKSGGEWISSVDLETTLVEHPGVREAAVIGVPDPRWEERPLAVVALNDANTVTSAELRALLSAKFAKWQIPEKWAFVDHVPRTSVGKYDKKAIRLLYAEGRLGDTDNDDTSNSAGPTADHTPHDQRDREVPEVPGVQAIAAWAQESSPAQQL